MIGEKSPEEALGHNVEEYYSKEVRKELKEKILKIAVENDYWVGEIELLSKTGRRINTIQNIISVKDEKGHPSCLGNLLIDITYMKNIEEELIYAKDNYKDIIDSINDAIFIHDIDTGNIVDANKKACEMYGYTKEEILSIDPKERFLDEKQFTAKDAIERIMKAKEVPQVFEWKSKNKSGEIFWEEIHLKKTKVSGKDTILATVRDITARKKAIEELKNSEAKLQSILRSAPVGIGLVNNRVIKWVNDRLCEMVGYSEEELIGKSSIMLYPNDEEFKYVGDVKYEQIKKYGAGCVETKWKRKDGQIIDVLLSSCAIDPKDLNAGVTFSAMDITTRKEAEEKLSLNEERFRAITENTSDVTVIIDKDNYFKYVSPSVYKLIGYTAEEVLKKNLKHLIVPEDLPMLDAIGDKAFAEPKKTFVLESFRVKAKGGNIVYFEGVLMAMPDTKGINGIVANCRDITKRIETERQIRLLSSGSEQTKEGVSILDENQNIVFVNQSFAEMHGYNPVELIGKHVSVYHNEEQMNSVAMTFEKLSENDEFSGEIWHKRKDGSVFPGFMHVTPLKDNNGRTVNIVGTLTDITANKKAEETLKKLSKAVEQSPA